MDISKKLSLWKLQARHYTFCIYCSARPLLREAYANKFWDWMFSAVPKLRTSFLRDVLLRPGEYLVSKNLGAFSFVSWIWKSFINLIIVTGNRFRIVLCKILYKDLYLGFYYNAFVLFNCLHSLIMEESLWSKTFIEWKSHLFLQCGNKHKVDISNWSNYFLKRPNTFFQQAISNMS